MSMLQIQNMTFSYPGAAKPIFNDINLTLDTQWRLGLIGRNGRGKTTFLKLLLGELSGSGIIACSESFEYFPVTVPKGRQTALSVARNVIAPFDMWENQMEYLINEASDQSIQTYGEIEQCYSQADGYTINQLIQAEVMKLDMPVGILAQPFHTLSGGEQVKLLLSAIFLKKHRFLLIDEPTDHLDLAGRRVVADWLRSKSGYILVSHDRSFLDTSIDHVLSINKGNIDLQAGNYTTWHINRTRQDRFEQAEHDKLTSSIQRLKKSAQKTAHWAGKLEKSKNNSTQATYNHGPASVDKGYIGHQAARLMQRSKSIATRQERQIKEKEALLKNLETVESLQIQTLAVRQKRLLTLEHVGYAFGNRVLFSDLSFNINEGDRIAIQGRNGCGKSTLLKIIQQEIHDYSGKLVQQNDIMIAGVEQNVSMLSGDVKQYAQDKHLDISLLLAILRKLNFERDAFSRDIANFSMGEKKKICLAAALAKPSHLLVWDEPLNYIDVLSREQIEQSILKYQPTMIFVEHDQRFSEKVATQVVEL